MQEMVGQALGQEDSGGGNGTPLQHSCLENPMAGGARQAAVLGATESDTAGHTMHKQVQCTVSP